LLIIWFCNSQTLSTFIREVKYHRLDNDQLRKSVLYAEQELSTVEDGGCTVTTTFTLIKALLSRQHNCPELKELMTHVAKASITCERDAVRTQARQTFYQYLMDYPIGKALNGHVQFFLSQLEYEVQNGRESALEMITLLIKTLPPVSIVHLTCSLCKNCYVANIFFNFRMF